MTTTPIGPHELRRMLRVADALLARGPVVASELYNEFQRGKRRTVRVHVREVLIRLERRGLVRRAGGLIIVMDPAKLAQWAEAGHVHLAELGWEERQPERNG